MITIKGGCLHQWEADREVELTCVDIDKLFWSNPRMSEQIPTEPETKEFAKIPNELLHSPAPITVYAHKGDKVVDKATFEVEPRKKPSNYVYEPTKVLQLQEVLDRAIEAETNAVEATDQVVALVGDINSILATLTDVEVNAVE